MNYKIVVAQDGNYESAMKKLETRVYSRMLDGYKPQGGVSIATEKYGYKVYYTVCQAMIKE